MALGERTQRNLQGIVALRARAQRNLRGIVASGERTQRNLRGIVALRARAQRNLLGIVALVNSEGKAELIHNAIEHSTVQRGMTHFNSAQYGTAQPLARYITMVTFSIAIARRPSLVS